MKKSTYDTCFFYKINLLNIIEMQINNILILTDNNFANKKKKIIKETKIITKDCKYLTFI